MFSSATRARHALKLAGVKVSYVSELQKIFRRAVDIGAAVHQHRVAAGRGDQRRHSRPADAAHTLDQQRRPGKQCAGAASRDKGVALAGAQHLQPHRHG